MPPWAKDAVDEWLTAANIQSGCVFRAINKCGCVHGKGISAQTVYTIITGYGVNIGVDVVPHDLRRSFARLAHSGKSPLEQIQLSLGHASVATTERYIGARQKVIDTPLRPLGHRAPFRCIALIRRPMACDEVPYRNRLLSRHWYGACMCGLQCIVPIALWRGR
jgi:hypothetical protein